MQLLLAEWRREAWQIVTAASVTKLWQADKARQEQLPPWRFPAERKRIYKNAQLLWQGDGGWVKQKEAPMHIAYRGYLEKSSLRQLVGGYHFTFCHGREFL